MNLYHVIAKGMDNDTPNPPPYFEMLKFLVPEAQEIQPEEIFEQFKECDNLNDIHPGNLHLFVLFNRLSAFLENKKIEHDFFINSLDSHFYINQEEMKDLDDFLLVQELK